MSSVASHARDYLLLLLFSLLLLLYPGNAADTFDNGRRITDGETLVSAGGSFTMGIFSLGEPARRYLGIWFSVSEDAVCWVANRRRPINGTSGVLVLGNAGTLLLLDGGGQVAWSSNATGVASPVAQLLDSGNLVVRDKGAGSGDGLLLWQSFDHPSNTLLPGMKTGKNLWTGAEWYITSWRSPTDPSPGLYRRGMETAWRRRGYGRQVMEDKLWRRHGDGMGTSAAVTTDGFAVVRGVKLPDTHNVTVEAGISLEECRERCLTNCSCVAYAASDIRAGAELELESP